MKLSEVLSRKGRGSIRPTKPIPSWLQLMLVSHNIGALAILSGDGVLAREFLQGADADVLRLVSRNAGQLAKLDVGEFLTRNVVTGSPDDSVEEAMSRMTERRIRHLPIVQHGRLVGII